MNLKPLLLIFLVLTLKSFSQERILFSKARFHTGDDPQWKETAFDDSQWQFIATTQRWEEQGCPKYDGYAWYRIRFILPSSLKQHSLWKDTLSFLLSKIDDVDETFLNGVKIGQTGSFPSDPGGYHGKWDVDRLYNISGNNSIIQWDKENVIAVRVFDFGDGGGIFGAIPAVKMMEPLDVTTVTLKPYNDISGNYITSIANTSTKTIKGTWTILVKDEQKVIKRIVKQAVLKPFEQLIDSLHLPLNKRMEVLSAFKDSYTGKAKSSILVTPYILTPPPSQLPVINNATVFGVRPGSPFLFKIAATGKKPLRYEVVNLPQGLTLNENTGVIAGKVITKGDYKVQLIVYNRLGKAMQEFTIKSGDKLALTPPMGWNSWNCWGLTVSEEKVKSSAQAIIDKGLIDYGWTYINIDDGWEDSARDQQGYIVPNEKFKNISLLCSWLHERGLKSGIYSSPGTKTCGGYLGSYQHELKDASSYAAWGIDYLKYDWCSYDDIFYRERDSSLEAYRKPYKLMQDALQAQPRDIVYSLCQYGMKDVWRWGAEVNGNSWRTTGDIRDTWESVKSIGLAHPELYSYAKPGHWNDPDMLVVGQLGWSGNLRATRLTPDEQYAHISLWSLLSAPLLIGCDVSRLDSFTLNLLTNAEVLAIDQDALGRQAQQKIKTKNYEVWVKDMQDGSKAVGVFNLSDSYQNIAFKLNSIGLNGVILIRDVWRQKKLGTYKEIFSSKVPPHGVTMVKMMISKTAKQLSKK